MKQKLVIHTDVPRFPQNFGGACTILYLRALNGLRFLVIAGLALPFVAAGPAAAEITVQTDRNRVALNESVELTIAGGDSVDGQSAPPTLPDANYFEVAITNNTHTQGFGQDSDNLYVSLVSQKEAYKFTQYLNASGQTVYVAEVDTSPGLCVGSKKKKNHCVASKKLSELTNNIDDTLGFYIKVFDDSLIAFTGGRIYFADEADAVPYNTGPGGINPDADFEFDFVEFTVDAATHQLNLDATQVDQFGMPIYLQVNPVVPDFANGTGIRQSETRAKVIQEFKNYTAEGSNYTAYQGVYALSPTRINRLLAPQHVIDRKPEQGLTEAFDKALYSLFNYYYSGAGGEGHTFYLVGNGSNGFEIFSGRVIDNFQVLEDKKKSPPKDTYTVFEFTGSGLQYNGTDASLTSVKVGGGAIYQIFYPYFGDNEVNSSNTGLSSDSPAPQWFGGLKPAGDNVLLSSAGRMVFGASGVFADDTAQKAYYSQSGQSLPTNFDHTMLGNLENQLVTMLNRGVAPDTGNPPDTGNLSTPNNMQLRTGSNSANDLIYVDLAQKKSGTKGKLAPDSSSGATTSWTLENLIKAAKGSKSDGIVPSSLKGTIYYKARKIQTFSVKYDIKTTTFKIDVKWVSPKPNPANHATGGQVTQLGTGRLKDITIDWDNATGIPSDVKVSFSFDYGPATSEAHYATLHLFNPYGQPELPYSPGDLGPASDFSKGLVGASSPTKPTSGMTMTGISLTNPTYVYQVTPGDDSIIIHSPQSLEGLNTNILTFSKFYPVDSNNDPIGQWNAYAAFFHIGDPANGVSAPTVDGKGYGFAFDDNGGYSSDITVDLPNSNKGKVVTRLSLTLLPWEKSLAEPKPRFNFFNRPRNTANDGCPRARWPFRRPFGRSRRHGC